METINKRNTETFQIVIKQQNEKLLEQQQRIDLLNTAVANLTNKLTELETMLIIQKIKMTGTGPSVNII